MMHYLNKRLQAGRITRYHTEPMITRQDVGNHTYGLMHIILAIEPDASADLFVAALEHDVPELATGDVPAPAKWYNPDLDKALRSAEQKFIDEYDVRTPALNAYEYDVLKVADMAELVLHMVHEYSLGNRNAKKICIRGMHYLQDNYGHHDGIDNIGVFLRHLYTHVKKELNNEPF